MSKEEIFQKMNLVLPAIAMYNTNRTIDHITEEQKEVMYDLYEKELVKAYATRGCGGCLKHVADVIWSASERMFPMYWIDKAAAEAAKPATKKVRKKKSDEGKTDVDTGA